ncbi:MAG: ABC transporter ATP-binding protein [Armatimonadetes bacterium]|nr:ABC transporter ATP-binding protein [Armatimonadota bacterium]
MTWLPLRRFTRALTRQLPGRTAGVVVLTLVSSVLSGAGAALLLPLLQAVGVRSGAGDVPPMSVQSALALFSSCMLLQVFIQRWQVVEAVRLTEEFTRRLQNRLYQAVERARWEVLLTARAGDLLHASTLELRQVAAAAQAFPAFLSRVLLVLVYLLLAAVLAPALTAAMLGTVLILLFLLRRHIDQVFRLSSEVRQRWREQTGSLEQYLDGFKLARCYGVGERHRIRLAAEALEVARLLTATAHHQVAAQTLFRLALIGSLCGLVYVAVGLLQVPPAQLLMLLYLFSRVVPFLAQAKQHFSEMVADLPAFVQLEDLLRRLETSMEQPDAPGPPLELNREVRFEEVHYEYPGSGGRGVHGVTLGLEAGRITALVGPSGAGKTTVSDLLLGLLEPQKGLIAVDGVRLSPELLSRWRASIGYVMQETYLFHDTIRANLLWACPSAREDDLWRALEQAAVADFARSLPEGLETVVGDRGVRLSGGERQRLALARAFLRQPSLLILDEPTSSLDEATEDRILEVLEGLRGKVTVLVITHRGHCAARADRLYRLEGGSIPE